MEESYFWNLIDLELFESFSTSEKVRWCLEKDIFYIAPRGVVNYGIFNCVDFDKLELSQFDIHPFDIVKRYRIDGFVISASPFYEEEIFNLVCSYYELLYMSNDTSETDKIKFKLNLLAFDDKIDFLIKKIDEIDPLSLRFLHIGYWEDNDEINIGPELKYNLLEITPKLQIDWVTGKYDDLYPLLEVENKDFFEQFKNEYFKLLTYKYCIRQINRLKESHVQVISATGQVDFNFSIGLM